MQLLEVIAVEIGEKPAAPHRVLRDLGVVYLPVPVGADLLDGRHCTDYKAADSSDRIP
jgi:hypothetical protein